VESKNLEGGKRSEMKIGKPAIQRRREVVKERTQRK
jgi:hypothetical protein